MAHRRETILLTSRGFWRAHLSLEFVVVLHRAGDRGRSHGRQRCSNSSDVFVDRVATLMYGLRCMRMRSSLAGTMRASLDHDSRLKRGY